MSAFMLAQSKFQELANRLAHIPKDGHGYPRGEPLAYRLRPESKAVEINKLAVKIAREWHKANVLAVTGRYGDNAQDMGVDNIVLRKPTNPTMDLVGTVKLLQCLDYQCAEDVGVDADKHEKLRAEMIQAAAFLALDHIETLPEYEEAAWGGR